MTFYETTTYKTLYGSHPVKVMSPTPTGEVALYLDENTRAMADAIEDLQAGVTGPAGPQGATGETGAQGPAGTTGWTESTSSSTTPSFSLDDGQAIQCTSTAITSLTLTTGTGWDSVEGMALVEFYSPATAPSFSVPSTWKVMGDDVVSGVFSPSASTWYTLYIGVLFGTVRLTVQIRTA